MENSGDNLSPCKRKHSLQNVNCFLFIETEIRRKLWHNFSLLDMNLYTIYVHTFVLVVEK